LVGQVVIDPARHFAQGLDRADRGLLEQLAQCRVLGFLALVDATLRHLPGRAEFARHLWIIVRPATADEHQPRGVEHCDADAVAVRHLLAIGLAHVGFFIKALTGTRVKPRSSAVLLHSASVVTEIGSADMMPIALPLSVAFCSRAVSWSRIDCRAGVASSA